MSFELYQRVVLTRDLPEEGLRQGDVATVVTPLELLAEELPDDV